MLEAGILIIGFTLLLMAAMEARFQYQKYMQKQRIKIINENLEKRRKKK